MLTDDNFIDFNCPHCGASNSFPSECSGRIEECPVCGRDLIAPEPGIATGLIIPLPMTLSTVTLRPVDDLDGNDLATVFTEDASGAQTEMDTASEHALMKWIESEKMLKFTSPCDKVNLAIESVDSKKVIGVATIEFREPSRQQVSVNVVIVHAFRRKGYGTEALSALLHLCFDSFHLHRVTASCEGDNIAGWRLLDTVGMRREGELVKSVQVNGAWTNQLLYGILREEYRFGDEAP